MARVKEVHVPTRLSGDLKKILDHAAGKEVMIQEIIDVLHGRGFYILVILLAFPFLIPIPIPGLSVIFGMALLLFGLRIALRKKPWLPHKFLEKKISYQLLSKIVSAALYVVCRMEKILHPRLHFFTRWASFSVLNGLMITSNAFILMLPLPIPFTNSLPAISIVLLAAGMMEEDGAVIFSGYIVAAVAWLYLIFIWLVGNAGLKMGLHWFGL